ncbi:MAG TPA: TRAP transporter substrate-binding protein [Xanthobacteraceae bacterium]|nr:TRAP transporter substrate-binding protein [Xanthobacteraceae bacterium]
MNSSRKTPTFATRRKAAARTVLAALLILPAPRSGALAAPDQPGEKPYVMKIAFATINDALHQFAKNYATTVEKDSGGRIKVEIYPASQLGSTQRQAEGVQFGAIQAMVVPPEFLAGIDERFELLAAPGLVTSIKNGQGVAADPAVKRLMLALGADKGLHGVGLFMVTPSAVVAIKPIRHLDDFKGKKIRIFASQFQKEALQRLGATPKPMTLGEVLPALQDNILDGAIAGTTVFSTMHYQDAAKYVTEIGQPVIFGIVEISKKWYDGLPADLREIVDRTASAESVNINSWVVDFNAKARQDWISSGGELISLPAQEQSAMINMLASVGEDVSAIKPELHAAYHIISEAAQRTR